MLDKNKVVIGLSGGVDSTVAAYLLKKRGYDVIGITMKLWDDPSEDYVENYGGCCSLSAVEDARRVAAALDIPFYVVNFKTPFKRDVVDYFVQSYTSGETPNPCVMCNRYIKFDKLIDKAKQLGAYYVATGHYANIVYDASHDHYRLFRSREQSKDQTYMLAYLTQAQMKHILFPLAEFSDKQAVRRIAEALDLAIAAKRDSQEICFVPDNDYANFVLSNSNTAIEPGNFVDLAGNVLGRHRGIVHYTIGQRKGLGITFGKPMYVVAIRAAQNEIVLGEAGSEYAAGLIARDFNKITRRQFCEATAVSVRVRHSKRDSEATIVALEDGNYQIMFKQAARAITPGQAVVVYDGDEVLGGGIIDRVLG